MVVELEVIRGNSFTLVFEVDVTRGTSFISVFEVRKPIEVESVLEFNKEKLSVISFILLRLFKL